jgi:hypothetical protein
MNQPEDRKLVGQDAFRMQKPTRERIEGQGRNYKSKAAEREPKTKPDKEPKVARMKMQSGLLAKPDYVLYDGESRLQLLYCKVCGVEIGGGSPFSRNEDYAELKMVMTNGSTHITCACKVDAKRAMKDVALMQAMYEADIPFAMPYEANAPREVAGAVSLTLGAGGTI